MMQKVKIIFRFTRRRLPSWYVDTVDRIPWAFCCALAIALILYMNLTKQATKEQPPPRQPTLNAATQKPKSLDNATAEKKMAADSAVQARRDSIARAEFGKANSLARQENANGYPWYIYLFAIPALAMLYWLYFDYLRKARMDLYVKDKDPDELRRLFLDFSPTIATLGTPRKLKRFSNRIRFQYNLLEISGDFKKSQRPRDFFAVMTLAEQNRTCYTRSPDEFVKEFSPVSADEELLLKIYEYNVNILV